MNKTYKILEGKHSSGFHFRPHIGKSFLQYDILFNKSAVYQFNDNDQYDINKLFGLSYGHHHTNSVRFGWRSLGKYSNMIEILAYCYVDGKRMTDDENAIFIAMVHLNDIYTYRINVSENNYTLTIFNKGMVTGQKEIPHKGLTFWGYQLYPYFGGNRKAPHDIRIHFSK